MTVNMEGLRALEVNRSLAELVREVVQNCLDANPGHIGVRIEKNLHARQVEVVVVDDGDGLPSLDVVSTVYLSTKADDATKRGRMGRGLKEAIVAADYAYVESTCGSVEVTRHKKSDWSIEDFPRRKLEKGTRVTLHYRTANASREAAEDAVAFVRRIVPPVGIVLAVNEHVNDALPQVDEYTVRLPTVVFGEGEERTVMRETKVLAYAPDAAGAWLYEMGVPVQPVDHEHSLDVQQRVPMPPHRDTVKPEYLQRLYAQVLNARVERKAMDADALSSKWAIEAAQQPKLLSEDAKQAFVHHFTQGATVSRTTSEQREAENWEMKSIPMRAIPQAVRPLVVDAAPRTSERLKEIGRAACETIPRREWTVEMRRAARVFTFLAHEAGYARFDVAFTSGRPTLRAQMSQETGRMEVFVDVAPDMLRDPLGARSLQTFIHELAHDDHGSGSSHDEVHGRDFYEAMEKAAGLVTNVMYKRAARVHELMDEESSVGSKNEKEVV